MFRVEGFIRGFGIQGFRVQGFQIFEQENSDASSFGPFQGFEASGLNRAKVLVTGGRCNGACLHQQK